MSRGGRAAGRGARGGGAEGMRPPPMVGARPATGTAPRGIPAWAQVRTAAGTTPAGGGGGGESPPRSAGAALPPSSIPVLGGRLTGRAAARGGGYDAGQLLRLSQGTPSSQSLLQPLSLSLDRGVSQASQDSTMATPRDQPIMLDGHMSPPAKRRTTGAGVGGAAAVGTGTGAPGGPFDVGDMRRSLESVETDPGQVRRSSDRLDPRGALGGAPPSVARERAQRSVYEYMTPVPACRVNPYLPALPAGGGRGAKKRSRRSQMMFKDDGVGGGVASRYFGDYEELCLLGRGSYSAVYKVRHRLDGTMYAVKKMIRPVTSEADLQHALNEVFALSVLQSCPYILRYVRARVRVCLSFACPNRVIYISRMPCAQVLHVLGGGRRAVCVRRVRVGDAGGVRAQGRVGAWRGGGGRAAARDAHHGPGRQRRRRRRRARSRAAGRAAA